MLKNLLSDLKASPLTRTSTAKVTWDPYPNKPEYQPKEKLTQDFIWPVSPPNSLYERKSLMKP